MNIEEVLQTAPEKLKTLETEYFTLKEERDELQGSCEARRIAVTGEVEEEAEEEKAAVAEAKAKGEVRKASLGNATKRMTEVTSRLGRDETYVHDSNKMTALSRQIKLKEIDIQYNDRQFKAARALASLRAN